ncbi:dienelactone hydrolase family protein [Phenylobacterium sp.]|uniref:dienelactone hydrolase family protein n=1 Tax=Phenylobacterium sp. TaxID=1871053 RepID=UPI0035ADB038
MSETALTPARFRDRDVVFANGLVGRDIAVPTANPVNFHQAISAPGEMAPASIDAKLFLPPVAAGALTPAVIVTPGSLGVAVSHLAHAEALTDAGIAALVIDPFGARGVTSTVANQAQYSFAASGYDVLAALRVLAETPGIDPARIGAQGHSRGGSAVLTAASARFADAVMGEGPRLAAVYAAYPWCGQQFADPSVGETWVRAIIGERDEWCSPQQAQGCLNAIRLTGGRADFRLVADAAHSFDRESPLETIAEASVSPAAPTTYIADDGAMIHPLTGLADPALVDRDLMVYALKAGFGVRGAEIGSKPGQPALFRADMMDFWRRALVG